MHEDVIDVRLRAELDRQPRAGLTQVGGAKAPLGVTPAIDAVNARGGTEVVPRPIR